MWKTRDRAAIDSPSRRRRPVRANRQYLRASLRPAFSGVAHSLAAKRVELGIVAFGPVSTVTDFVTADEFDPPELQKVGDTPTGAAIERAVEMIRQRKEVCTTGRLARACLGEFSRQPWLQRGIEILGMTSLA